MYPTLNTNKGAKNETNNPKRSIYIAGRISSIKRSSDHRPC